MNVLFCILLVGVKIGLIEIVIRVLYNGIGMFLVWLNCKFMDVIFVILENNFSF